MKNYDAWKINPEDFYKQKTRTSKIEFLVRFGILAPSSHNTQPWKFHVDNDVLYIYADLSRRLAMSDESGRMLYMALGCAIENIRIAATSYGLLSHTKYNNGFKNFSAKYAAKINFSNWRNIGDRKEITSQQRHYLRAIIGRASYREKYKDTKISQDFFNELKKLNNNNALRVDLFSSEEDKKRLSCIVADAVKNKMSDKAFRRELADWVRSNITLRQDGMPGSGHGMKLIKSIIAPFVLRHIDISNTEGAKAMQRTSSFPVIGIISSSEDTALRWVHAGEYLEYMLIKIYSDKMSASIMAAPIEDSDSRIKLEKIIDSKALIHPSQTWLPQIFFGFGFPQKASPHSPRRDINQVIIYEETA